ncbi:acyl-CoA dehydrogenase family protein [Nonomuraea longicatena]|uniref:Acyl-CoA dehydrogenase family protein n=1 Tax=Nonomuraea longicatena TaxID=83682 RepID=A0ABN1P2H2_9ACTN
MDFTLDETQKELRDLTARLLAEDVGPDALRAAGLFGVCLPEEVGGAGLGAVEMAVVLREVGARDLPALPLLVGSLAVAAHGSREQQAKVAQAGLTTVAHRDQGRETTARYAAGWTLTGRKSGVPYGAQADLVLVAADRGLFLAAPGRSVPEFTATGAPAATLVFDGTPAEKLDGGDPGALARLFTVGVAAQAGGVLAGALALTTEYVRTRRQFGRALAEFQAVTMQIADVYIASRALDVAMWSAAWGLSDKDVALAGFHVSEAYRALFTCQHLHGGLGLDVTYPLHRAFAHAKHLTHLLGGADAQLDLIGALV